MAQPPRIALAHLVLVGAMTVTGVAGGQPVPPTPPAPTGDAPPQNPNAGATGDATLQDARRAYDEGSTHYVAGRYREALIAFERAYSLRPNPVVLMPILECHDHLGHVPEAIRTLEAYLTAVPSGRNRPLLESRLANLRQRPARVHFISTPPGARLEVDGAEVAQRSPTYLELPAGRHTVTATAPGHLPTSHEFEALPGTPRDELLTLEADPAAAPVGSGPSVVGPRVTTPRSTSPVVWVAAGLAGVGLIAGTTFGVLALSDNNLYDADPTRETRDRGLRYALLSDVSFGVAAASGALALIVYFVERSRTPPEPRAPNGPPVARLRLAPGGVHLEF
jgi:hypothetical protein